MEKKQENRYSVIQVKNYLEDESINFEKKSSAFIKKDSGIYQLNKLNNRKSVSTFFLNMIDKNVNDDKKQLSLVKDDINMKKSTLIIPIHRVGKSTEMLNQEVQTCYTCKNEILSNEKGYQNKYSGYCYHTRCIKCCSCGQQSESMRFIENGSRYRCENCDRKYSKYNQLSFSN